MATPLRRSVRNQKTVSLVGPSRVPSTTVHVTSTVTNGRKRVKREVEEQVSANGIPSSSIAQKKVSKATTSAHKNVLRMEDYPDRVQINWKVGAHVSAAGGVENTILNAASIGFVPLADYLLISTRSLEPMPLRCLSNLNGNGPLLL